MEHQRATKPFSSYLKPETRQSIAESERLDNLHISSEQDESNHEEPEITEDFDINYTDNERDSSSSTLVKKATKNVLIPRHKGTLTTNSIQHTVKKV